MKSVTLISVSLLSAMLLVSAGFVSAEDVKQPKQYNLDTGSKFVVGTTGFLGACAVTGTAGYVGIGTHIATENLLKNAPAFDKANVMSFIKARNVSAMARPVIHSGRAAILLSLLGGVYEIGIKTCLGGAKERIWPTQTAESASKESTSVDSTPKAS